MPHISYIANGYCANARQTGDMAGMSELRFWNPTSSPNSLRMTVYYADKPPVDLPEYSIGPEANPLLVFPQNYPEQFDGCGPWGMKLVSDTMLLADHILYARHEGPPDNVMYRGGVGDTLVKTRPSRLWYFSDGIRIKHKQVKPPFPFNEYEWYHILNPNAQPAHVVMRWVHGPGRHEDFHHTVGAQRILMIDNYDYDRFTGVAVCYGIRFISDQPIIVESERVIYGQTGKEEWGAYIHCQRPGLPAPLDFNEDAAQP
jgi:hypothetical protein